MPKKVLVTGASGLLGRQVLESFEIAGWQVVGTGHSRAKPPLQKLDIEDEAAAALMLDREKPQVLVHCAANRFPDKCSADPEAARRVNVEATRSLAKACAARAILFIYVSTDYVFSGREGDAPYEADAETGPTNLYGQTKLDGEKAALEEGGSLAVVLRVPVLYGAAGKNAESAVNVLVDTVWKAQDKQAGISMDDWAQRYPTNTEDCGRVIRDIAERYLSGDSAALPRTLQFSSEDRFTKFEICQLLAEVLGLPLEGMVANKQGNDPKAATQRPYDTHLSTRALKEMGIPVWTQDFKAWWRRELNAFRH